MYNHGDSLMNKISTFLFAVVFFAIGAGVYYLAVTRPEICEDPATIKIVGCFFMAGSLMPLIFKFLKKMLKNRTHKLEHTGQLVWATVKEIEVDYSTTVNGMNPHWVVCEVVNEAENTIYRYTSRKVYEDLFYRIEPGNKVAVYVNYDDPDDYYVNLNEIM